MRDNGKEHVIISFDKIKKQKSKDKVSKHIDTLEEELEVILEELIIEEENREV